VINRRILIIDGHPVYVNKIIGFLRGLTFKDITLAPTGKEGIDFVRSKNPNLIILSGMLQDMDSLEACKAIRAMTDESVKIIVQTGLFTKEEDIKRFKDYGADAVLTRKEKDLQPLQDAIEGLLFSALPR